MRLVSMILAAGIFASTTTAAVAETLTARVIEWNPLDRAITFDDQTELFFLEGVPVEGLRVGSMVMVVFYREEDGFGFIQQIVISNPDDDRARY